MRSKTLGFLMTLALIFTAGSVFAQDAAEAPAETAKKDKVKKPVLNEIKGEESGEKALELEGRIWSEYQHELKDAKDKDATTGSAFAIKRAYFTAGKKLDDVFSVKLTMDAIDLGSKTTIKDINLSKDQTVSTEGKEGYQFFIKNAYLQAEQKNATLGYKFQFGMVGTPVMGLIDNISDYRWITNNYIDQSKSVLKNGFYDSSADMGAKVDLNIMKMITVTGAYLNGEGYKTVKDSETDGEAVYGMAVFNPDFLKELYIAGYTRMYTPQIENKDKILVEKKAMYYGGGIGWKSDFIKAGVFYTMGTYSVDGTDTEKTSVLDAYVNANLKSVAGVPVLLMGRYVMGKDAEIDDSDVTVMAAGVGYQINERLRALVYFEQKTYADEVLYPEKSAQNLYVKTEARF